MNLLSLENFPSRSFDKIRYGDTDRQGHVNNAVFSTFLETGRVEVLYNPKDPILGDGFSFVIASLQLDFLTELTWPGEVQVGTGIVKIGNSSISILQGLFQDDRCAATAKTVIVHVDNATRRSAPLTEHARGLLGRWLLPEVE